MRASMDSKQHNPIIDQYRRSVQKNTSALEWQSGYHDLPQIRQTYWPSIKSPLGRLVVGGTRT